MELKHNAIIIDERTNEGIHVTVEGQPSHLGQELRLAFHRDKPLIIMCNEIHANRQLKSATKIEAFYPLTKEEVELAVAKGRKGLHKMGFNVRYYYVIREDGVYVECRLTGDNRKVADTRTEQYMFNSPVEQYKRAYEISMKAVGKDVIT